MDPQKVQYKFGSSNGDWDGDGVDNPKKLTSLCYSYGDKNLGWQYLQKCIISTIATYIWYTCEKFKKKMEFRAENGIDQ